MKWLRHLELQDTHAFLSASKYHWIRYDEEKLINSYLNNLAVQKGTELHEFASKCIRLKQKLEHSDETLNMFVNDAIDFNMRSEQTLYYSLNCYGTADAITFDEDNRVLMIFDLKTGKSVAHIEQLMIYAALFCLEYDVNPRDIYIELRIYQGGEIKMLNPLVEDICDIMDKIIAFDTKINEVRGTVYG